MTEVGPVRWPFELYEIEGRSGAAAELSGELGCVLGRSTVRMYGADDGSVRGFLEPGIATVGVNVRKDGERGRAGETALDQ